LWTFENMFEPLLFISPLDNTDNNPNNPQNAVYDIWNNFRIIANIAFVIIFFFAIAANSFGFLLTPYDFKKTMPRLAIGFIGVQISFYVCGWLIDIFNILGAGV